MTSDDFTPTDHGFHEAAPVALPRTITPSGARRVPPSETVPRLSAKKEAKLAAVDAESARGYDAIEAAGDKIAQLTQLIADGVVDAPLEIDDSLVIKLTKLVPP
jgi:hypothetical protein